MTIKKMEKLTYLYQSYLNNRREQKGEDIRQSSRISLDGMAKIYAEETGMGINWRSQEEILIDWVKKEINGPLLNILLAEAVNNTDPWVLQNIEVLQKMFTEVLHTYEEMAKTPIKLAEYSRQMLMDDVKHILLEIDSSGELLEEFKINLGKSIIFLNDLPEDKQTELRDILDLEKGASATFDLVFGPLTLLSLHGTIEDLVDVIHEFMHFINVGHIRSIDLLSEYPSIMWEMYSLEYLKRKGYEEKEIASLYLKRYQDVMGEKEVFKQIIGLFKVFLRDGVIRPEEMGNKNYDKLIKILNADNQTINHMYPYVIGVWLASKSMQKMNEVFRPDELMFLTCQVGEINLNNLIRRLDETMIEGSQTVKSDWHPEDPPFSF